MRCLEQDTCFRVCFPGYHCHSDAKLGKQRRNVKQIYALVEEAFPSIANRDPVVRRGDKSRYPQKIYPEAKIDCVARSRDKFILWINSASPEIKLNQRLSRVKSLW